MPQDLSFSFEDFRLTYLKHVPRKLSRQGLEKTKETSREIALQVAEAEKTEARDAVETVTPVVGIAWIGWGRNKSNKWIR